MDLYERMNIRDAAAWRKTLKAGGGGRVIDPTTGQIITKAEVHHIAGQKYGEQSVPLDIDVHQEMTRRQMEEHPPAGPDAENPLEQMGRFLLGAADLLEDIVATMRRFAELLLAWAAQGFHGPEEV